MDVAPTAATVVESDPEIARITHLAQTHLGMDVAFVSQFHHGKQVYLASAGDRESFGIELHDGPLLDATFCQKLIDNTIPPVIPNTADNPHVAGLAVTAEKGIGAYVGVPLTFSDGEVFGTFCCLSHNPDSALNERDARFMAMLADVLATRLQEGERRRRERERLLRVIDDADFAIALQPVVHLVTGELVGAEALARFGAMGGPDVVFGAARDLGVGTQLEAAAFKASRVLAGVLPDHAYLAMNLSEAALMDARMATILDLVDEPSRCVIELTEHVPVDRYGALAEKLAPLRERGFRLAVDDVGAGYASFHHVLELSPDVIKIDRYLVAGSSSDGARRRIIASIVLLGLDLGATVVAEGVEEPEDLQAVTELGVDAAQGYLLAHPTTDRAVVKNWSDPWRIDSLADIKRRADRRDAVGRVLRELRGDRRQIDVLHAINEHLVAVGESARISQGQYSAYEHGRDRPLPVRLRAIEAVFGLEAGSLTTLLDGTPAAAAAVTPSSDSRTTRSSIASRLGQRRRQTAQR